MAYALLDVDVALPLPDVRLGGDERGVGVLVRRFGRPVHFFLHETSAGAVLSSKALGELIGEQARVSLVRECLCEELGARGERSLPVSVTVAICTRNRPDRLRECLASLLDLRPAEPDDPRFFSVLVVDNAPAGDASRRVAQSFDDVSYIVEPRPGLDVARNRALEEVQTELIAYLDDDVVVDGSWLSGLEAALAEHPDAAMITGAVLPQELATKAQVVFEQRGGFRRGFTSIRFAGPRLPGNPLYPCGAGIFGAGCNMVARVDVLRNLGGFDNALDTGTPLPGGGDLDVFYRVVRAGFPLVYEPRLLVFHRHRRDLDGLRRQYASWGRGLAAFLVKSWLTDPSARRPILRLYLWWLGDELRELRKSLRGTSVLTPDLVLAEVGGGILGLGAYWRSRRRLARLEVE